MNKQKIICALVIMLLSLFGNKTNAQTFYDINTVQTISITFTQSNWDYMLDTAKAGSDGYIMAQSVTINGTTFDSVGVKYKGNSTYSANQVKNPFHIELDTYKDHIYQGYTDVKLSNVAKDPSYLREVLSYAVLRNYMDAPLSNYANVTVNGSLLGLYVSSESIGKKFVNNHFYSNDSTFFKCNPIDGAGPTTTTLPNLVYQGTDSNSVNYTKAYEIKSDYGWSDLITLTNTLKNNIGNIENVLDVDRALWMLAFNNVTVNLDSYSGVFSQNYYLYKDATGRFNPILWDFNESFGAFSQTGTINLANTSAKQQMTHLLHSGDANWPLIQQLLAVPSYKKMYLAHMHTILTENFSNGSYYTTAQAIQPVINASVQADPNKFYTYTQYQNNLTTDITTGGGPGSSTVPGITNLMNGRNTYLSALADFTNTKPVITTVTPSVAIPVLNSSIYITANVTNTTTSAVKLGYRYAIGNKFTKVQMFDDGAHGDGAAGDNVYGASLPVSSLLIQYYIYAENTNVGAFSPVRAEHEFYALAATNPVLSTNIVMNEIYARGTTTNPDWIEIYNKSNTAIDISGYKIYDAGGESGSKPKKEFPTGSIVAANGFLVMVTDDADASGFGLSSNGEKVWFENASAQLIDTITYAAHTAAQSYGRIPNGGSWELLDSITRNASNVANATTLQYDCANGITTGTATGGTVVSGLSFTIPYSAATVGATYGSQIITSTGITGLTATLASGTYGSAAGNLIFTVTGTPSGAGTASFSLSYGSSVCSYAVTVIPPFISNSNIVMNEIYARGTTADPDWIEIYNKSNAAIDISGYKIYDAGGESGSKPKKEFPTGSILTANGFLVIVVDDADASGFGLSSSGEKVWFENASAQLIDTITYAAHTAAQSYGRIPNGGNWQLLDSITKNASNVANATTLQYDCANGITTGTATGGTVVSGLSFTIPYSAATVGATYASQIITSTGVTGLTATLSAGTYATAAGNVIFIVTGTPSAAGTATFSLSYGSTNCSFSVTVTPPFLSNSNIVMNEIYARGTTADPDWIEIYNKSNAAIDISGYKIYDAGGESGSKPKKEFPTGSILTANGFLVIVVDDADVSGFGLSSSGEKVWFENASAQLIDTITYAAHTAAQSYGRIPNGGSWQVLDSITKNASNVANSTVVQYNCATGTTTGIATSGTTVSGLSFSIPFTNATIGATYAAQTIVSTGATGLTATVSSGTYNAATGNLIFTVTGTASGAGTASFNIVYGTSNCSYTITVNAPVPVLVYNCAAGITTGTATAGTAVSGLSFSIPYTNATIGTTYAAQTIVSTGVTGLTATVSSGTYAGATGNLNFTISGTASGAGTASFNIVYGNLNCSYSITVNAPAPVLVYNCAAGITTGTATAGTAVSGLSFSIPFTNATIGATYAAQTIVSTGVTGLIATRSSGTYTAATGNNVYTISGIPSSAGTANFSIAYGATACNYTVSVENSTVNNAVISIYPNPVQQNLFFKNIITSNVYSVIIFDAVGRNIMTLQQPDVSNGINVAQLPRGIYFLKLTETSTLKTTTYKFVKH